MPLRNESTDYDPLTRMDKPRSAGLPAESEDWSELRKRKRFIDTDLSSGWLRRTDSHRESEPIEFKPTPEDAQEDQEIAAEPKIAKPNEPSSAKSIKQTFRLRNGHGLTYAALFLFTVLLYARPAEFYPSAVTASIALVIGIITLIIFTLSQLGISGTLTDRPTEVNLILLLLLIGLLSIPFAINPGQAWFTFSDTFVRCIVIFIVMVNAVRTNARLKGLLLLALAVSLWLSVGAINDYRLGLTTVEGYRVAGRGSGIFGNSNDMALFLVTIVPVAVGLLFSTRRLIPKILYVTTALLMVVAIVLTYSRGAFIALIVSIGFLVWRLSHKYRIVMLVLVAILAVGGLAFAPQNYGLRLLSIFVPSLDPVGSSDTRREELFRSIFIALRHPLLGIGMGNYASDMSYRGLVTHNSYTQVASEMGMFGLACYTMFIVTPFRRLGQVVRQTFETRATSRYYYLAIALQASLLGYMVASFFASVAYLWYVYYLVAYAVCLRRLYESETGEILVSEKQKKKELAAALDAAE